MTPERTIRYGAVLPLPPDEAFAFLSDPSTWPRFFRELVSATAGPGWGTVGGQGRMVPRVGPLRLPVELELTAWEPPRAFRYTARRPGSPDLDNERVLSPVADGGTRLTATTTLRPRPGPLGVLDRVTLRLLALVFARGMRRLPAAAAARRPDRPDRPPPHR